MKKYDLEERLIRFAVSTLALVEKLPPKLGAQILGRQLCKSCTSPALNYAEAQGAESPRDFLHKMRICLKELRESFVCLRIIRSKPYLDEATVNPVLAESSELVAIFTTSVKTKSKNLSGAGKRVKSE